MAEQNCKDPSDCGVIYFGKPNTVMPDPIMLASADEIGYYFDEQFLSFDRDLEKRPKITKTGQSIEKIVNNVLLMSCDKVPGLFQVVEKPVFIKLEANSDGDENRALFRESSKNAVLEVEIIGIFAEQFPAKSLLFSEKLMYESIDYRQREVLLNVGLSAEKNDKCWSGQYIADQVRITRCSNNLQASLAVGVLKFNDFIKKI